jgi:hypothetical protein
MKKLFILLWLCSVSTAFAQNIRDYGTTKIRLNEPGRSIVMEVLPASKPSVKTDRLYYWFSGNVVHTTQGGFSGKLLNGAYNEYSSNKSLKEQGNFKQGLKNGIWKTWTEEGALNQQITWKNGMKDGAFILYDEQGNVRQSGAFNNNLLDGKVSYYHGKDSIETKIFKAGVPITPSSPKPTLWQKIKRFRFARKDSLIKGG